MRKWLKMLTVPIIVFILIELAGAAFWVWVILKFS